MNKKKISVIGLGYIGLPTATLLASRGFKVDGVDINPLIIKNLNKKKCHIKEKGVDQLLALSLNSGNLSLKSIPQASDVFIIAVPTPITKGAKMPKPNIKMVIEAVRSIIELIEDYNLIIIESTVPMGTTNLIRELLEDKGINTEKIYIAHCPERVLPGNILDELIHNDRIIGGINKKSSQAAEDFYKIFVKGKIYQTEAKTAELCKLTENSFRDVNIAFANELSMICDKENINVYELINLTNKHPRVNILQPGPGVGGHCIAVDPWFIISQNPNLSKVMTASRQVNLEKTKWVFDKIISETDRCKSEKNIEPVIACFGLTFKPDVDDIRESPSIEILEKLSNKGFSLLVVEPNIKKYKNFKIIKQSEAIKRANILVFLVNHKEFKTIKNHKKLEEKLLLDFCDFLSF